MWFDCLYISRLLFTTVPGGLWLLLKRRNAHFCNKTNNIFFSLGVFIINGILPNVNRGFSLKFREFFGACAQLHVCFKLFMFKTCEFCSAAEENKVDAEAAERRKCEKCVNHHEIVCNKRRRRGREKTIAGFWRYAQKVSGKQKKRTRNLPVFVWNQPVPGVKARKGRGNKMDEKEPKRPCSFSCSATGKRDTSPLEMCEKL